MNVLDLFSGIGGFSLGLERAGMRTVAFCEIDPYCREVLRKHWPAKPIFGDIRELTIFGGEILRERIDLICGGFPCQDISVAGKGAGIDGERSGLWSEYARIIGEVRPRYIIVENVAAMLGRGFGRVLGDLAALRYDAEWHCIPACAVGAPHRRDRVWIIANARSEQHKSDCAKNERSRTERFHEASSNTNSTRFPPSWPLALGAYWRQTGGMFTASDWWLAEPDVGRVAHGVPFRVDRLRSLGNAIVPQIAEIIGKAIMAIS